MKILAQDAWDCARMTYHAALRWVDLGVVALGEAIDFGRIVGDHEAMTRYREGRMDALWQNILERHHQGPYATR